MKIGKKIAIAVLTLVMALNIKPVTAKADCSYLYVPNKFFNVREEVTFEKLMAGHIIIDDDGNRDTSKDGNAEIHTIQKFNVSDPDLIIEDLDNISNIKPSMHYGYRITVGVQNKSYIFELRFWEYEEEYQYIRAIDNTSLNSLNYRSKWRKGKLAANLYQTLNKSEDECEYKYKLSANDMIQIRETCADDSYESKKEELKDIFENAKMEKEE